MSPLFVIGIILDHTKGVNPQISEAKRASQGNGVLDRLREFFRKWSDLLAGFCCSNMRPICNHRSHSGFLLHMFRAPDIAEGQIEESFGIWRSYDSALLHIDESQIIRRASTSYSLRLLRSSSHTKDHTSRAVILNGQCKPCLSLRCGQRIAGLLLRALCGLSVGYTRGCLGRL